MALRMPLDYACEMGCLAIMMVADVVVDGIAKMAAEPGNCRLEWEWDGRGRAREGTTGDIKAQAWHRSNGGGELGRWWCTVRNDGGNGE